MSVSEKVVWEYLRHERIGYKFRRQVPVGPYVLDFYCPEASLCVEVDGEQHRKRERMDCARERFLAERGIETVRIPSLDFFDRNEAVQHKWVCQVLERCRARTSPD